MNSIFTVERCLSGYIVTIGKSLEDRAWSAHEKSLHSDKWYGMQALKGQIHAFSCKEHVLDFLRKALTFDNETGLAKERKK
jgi:hypothetical protein